jgi:phage-related protein
MDFMKSEFNMVATFLEFSVFFDPGHLVVLANGFQKKTQKTPKKEIEMALKIKAEYELEISNSKK